MEKEQVVEVVKRPKNKAGVETIKSAQYNENGQLLVPFQKDGKMTMETFDAVKEILDKKTEQRKEKEQKKKPKVKFIPNGTGVDAVPVDPKPEVKEKEASTVFVKDLEESFKGILTVDTDKNGFVNFRIGKHVEFYAIDRVAGFIALSTRHDSAKSGWKTERIVNKKELLNAVETLKAQVENRAKFETAFVPWYLCPECDYKTTSKTEMTAHVGTHEAD